VINRVGHDGLGRPENTWFLPEAPFCKGQV
jgi:hypothetical protein